jgi:mannonate dehydratase
MRIAMTVLPYNLQNLTVAKQIGVDNIVYYDMKTMPMQYGDLRAEVEKLRRLGLNLLVFECGPPIDRIVLAKEGRDQQIEQYKRALDNMGRLGVEILCYNFMPQVMDDSMVVRTTYSTPVRGGALTSAFRLSDVTDATVPHSERPVPAEAMWDNLEYFLKWVIPAAEAAGVKLAMHPDDPPLSPICGLNRIMSSVESFDRLLSISNSPVNGVALCLGCFMEMGADPVQLAERFRDRINYMHFRDIAGVTSDFVETFPDDGPTDFIRIFQAFRRIGCNSLIRVDHVPRLAMENGPNDGYGFIGHLYATGYLKGLVESVFGKSSVDRWRGIPVERRASAYRGGPSIRDSRPA